MLGPERDKEFSKAIDEIIKGIENSPEFELKNQRIKNYQVKRYS